MRYDEVLRAVPGLSYRQLLHWTSRGYVPCADGASVGSGNAHDWSRQDVEVIARTLELVKLGFNPQAAGTYAETLAAVERSGEPGAGAVIGRFALVPLRPRAPRPSASEAPRTRDGEQGGERCQCVAQSGGEVYRSYCPLHRSKR